MRYLQRLGQNVANDLTDIQGSRPSGPGHVEYLYLVSVQKSSDVFRMNAGPDVNPRLAKPFGKFSRSFGASLEFLGQGENERRVRVAHIPFRPLKIRCRRRFNQFVLFRKRTVLGFTSLGTPPAIGNALRNCPVERGDIRTSLSAGDNFEIAVDHVRIVQLKLH